MEGVVGGYYVIGKNGNVYYVFYNPDGIPIGKRGDPRSGLPCYHFGSPYPSPNPSDPHLTNPATGGHPWDLRPIETR